MNLWNDKHTFLIAPFASLTVACCTTSTDVQVIKAASEAESSEVQSLDVRQFVGTWDVALFFSASSPPSSMVMEIRSINDDGTIEGSFYNTEFEVARYSERKDLIAFTFITSDGSGQYVSSGRFYGDGIVEGQTLSTGRDFLMFWEATPREAD